MAEQLIKLLAFLVIAGGLTTVCLILLGVVVDILTDVGSWIVDWIFPKQK